LRATETEELSEKITTFKIEAQATDRLSAIIPSDPGRGKKK